jgi:hypothetical protein
MPLETAGEIIMGRTIAYAGTPRVLDLTALDKRRLLKLSEARAFRKCFGRKV